MPRGARSLQPWTGSRLSNLVVTWCLGWGGGNNRATGWGLMNHRRAFLTVPGRERPRSRCWRTWGPVKTHFLLHGWLCSVSSHGRGARRLSGVS